MKALVRTMQIQRFLGACVSTLVMILWSWAPGVALASDKIAATVQGEGLRLESSMTGGGAEHSDLKVNPGGISIEGSWSWTASGGTVRIQVAKLVNHRSGGTSGTLRLEVWASSSPYNGGSMSGYKIGQVQLSPLTAGFQYTNIDSTVTQLTTPPAGSWYMTMVASEFTGSALNDGFSFVDWEAMTPNWVISSGNIALEGSVAFVVSAGTVRIQVAKLINHRSGGISGTLRLEVWASTSPYNGGSMSGYKIGQVQLSPLAAGFQYTNIDSTVTQLTTPPAGSWYMTMVASEFTGSALNDGFSFVDWAAMTPNWVIGSPVAYVTVVEFYNQFLNHYFRTANAGEAAWVDGGGAGPGWIRTGDNFIGYVRTAFPSGAFQVYRFYGSVSPGPNSHFYTASFAEYQQLINLQAITPASQPRWNYEEVAFAVDLPANGVCPARAPTRIYRAYNNGFARGMDSNHRYTTSLSAINQLVLQGWVAEGVVMCAA